MVDVAFIVDSSGSVAKHFGTIRTFVKNFIAGFDVAVNLTHVSMVTFADEPSDHFLLADEFDAEILGLFVDRADHTGGETYIDKALQLADEKVFNVSNGWRPNVTSVSVGKCTNGNFGAEHFVRSQSIFILAKFMSRHSK